MQLDGDILKKSPCPHCHEESISASQKPGTGPLFPGTCKACGKKVGVTYSSLLWMSPFFLSVFLAELIPLWIAVPLILFLFVFSSGLFLRFAPLIAKGK